MNNKQQTMKLYTEKQVRDAMDKASELTGDTRFGYAFTNDEVLAGLVPIELPSDEEIEKEFTVIFAGEEYKCYDMVEGAKWMRDKIQGGNK